MWSSALTEVETPEVEPPTVIVDQPRPDPSKHFPPPPRREYPIPPPPHREYPKFETAASRYLAPPHETVIPIIAPLTTTGWAFSNLTSWLLSAAPRARTRQRPAEDV
jgi:hypothetical protein